MCGIAGYWRFDGVVDRSWLHAMTDAIAHRGPDDAGSWFDEAAGVALGHRRLSIIDLRPTGHQPMASHDGRYVLVFNGEIYNHRALRAMLDAEWRGTSDTEVLLQAIEHWGLDDALKRANGMFALALWDREARTLSLARDRLGEKPLYWRQDARGVTFASELRALAQVPGGDWTIDREALGAFLHLGYVPAPLSIWQGVAKLMPATILTINPSGAREERLVWDVVQAATQPVDDRPYGEHLDVLDVLLGDAVALRMEADVDLGAFLSGGVDSSLIVAKMQAQSSRAVRTFSIGFTDRGYDESGHARQAAAHLGTDHTELYVDDATALATVASLPDIWDEPFADASQIPTFLLSRLTRREVTVSLSGDGGDELFGGYNRHVIGGRVARMIAPIPEVARSAIARMLRSRITGQVADTVVHALPDRWRHGAPSDRLPKVAALLDADAGDGLYDVLVGLGTASAALSAHPVTRRSVGVPGGLDEQSAMMFRDMVRYLPDDILVKVDRASMAVALECRVPFLDHRIVEMAWRLPANARFAGGRGKRILRDLLARYVPRAMFERPKAGFSVPLDAWLRGPLRPWAEDLLSARALADGYLDADTVRTLWTDYLAGRRQSHFQLWAVLMFQAWIAQQKSVTHRPRVVA